MKQRLQAYQQRGAALITSLIILLVLTVLGVSAMNTSSLEELMAGNLRDQNLSFQAAEAALKEGERYINSWGGMPPAATSSGTNNGLYIMDSITADFATTAYNTSVWDHGTTYGTNASTTSTDMGEVAALPVYIIEEQQFVGKDASFNAQAKREGAYYYRVTARGVGASSNAVSILQTTVAKRFK